MSLSVYEIATPSSDHSMDQEFTNPIRATIDGSTGGVTELKRYLRNNSASYWYENITLTLVDQDGVSIIDGTNGFSWKLKAGNTQPTAQEWAAISDGNAITMDDIGSSVAGDSTTYSPFWIRIEVPAGASVASYDDVAIVIGCTENLVV